MIQHIVVPYATETTTQMYNYYYWSNQMKTLKYFSATWCGPCQTFKPIMNEIAGEGYSVQFIDIDQSGELADNYRITSVPTIVIEVNGTVVDRFIGAVTKQQLLEKMM